MAGPAHLTPRIVGGSPETVRLAHAPEIEALSPRVQRSAWESEAAMTEMARPAVSMSRPIGRNPWIIPP